ncbi:MAG: ATP-dependent Clp protease proteolytic subunit [Lachnospiraceae bacterium]|nr:ATP-dependent Clp protease proteolytic subunit [Lachnospiraceae bacterium]
MRNNRESYYDIDFDIEKILVESGMIEELFYLKDLRQRKLFLNSDIEQLSVAEIVKHIMQYNKEDAEIAPEDRTPILLYIVSNGGEVDSGFELIDVIRASKTPVYTINLGYQYSMGFLIGIAGHKRFAAKNAKYLIHDGSSFVYNSGAKAHDQMEFQKKVEERVKRYILSRSNLTNEEFDSKLRVEWYLFADEAKEKGFVDYIIGEDCELDDVI